MVNILAGLLERQRRELESCAAAVIQRWWRLSSSRRRAAVRCALNTLKSCRLTASESDELIGIACGDVVLGSAGTEILLDSPSSVASSKLFASLLPPGTPIQRRPPSHPNIENTPEIAVSAPYIHILLLTAEGDEGDSAALLDKFLPSCTVETVRLTDGLPPSSSKYKVCRVWAALRGYCLSASCVPISPSPSPTCACGGEQVVKDIKNYASSLPPFQVAPFVIVCLHGVASDIGGAVTVPAKIPSMSVNTRALVSVDTISDWLWQLVPGAVIHFDRCVCARAHLPGCVCGCCCALGVFRR